MLFYFEFSYIQILLNIHTNELLLCKLISNTIYIYIYMFACTCINVMSNVIFAPPSQILVPPLVESTMFQIYLI